MDNNSLYGTELIKDLGVWVDSKLVNIKKFHKHF